MRETPARYMNEVRSNLVAWARWRNGLGPLTVEAELVEAVYQSGLLSFRQVETLRLVYLDPRPVKQKENACKTEYHINKRAVEDAIEHLVEHMARETA